jgi:APA family basic amino acid/polyamine antiporter
MNVAFLEPRVARVGWSQGRARIVHRRRVRVMDPCIARRSTIPASTSPVSAAAGGASMPRAMQAARERSGMANERSNVIRPGAAVPSRLARRLGTFDAVVIGLGAMIGAGVFAAIGPAARAAGNGLLLGLLIAAVVAWCNATSSAQLAAADPEAGGAYAHGRRRLGPAWGFVAGWGFVIGKLASCAAMALTFGSYAAPGLARPLAIAAVAGLTAVNLAGVEKTARLTRVIVLCVVAALAAVVAVWWGGSAELDRVWPPVGSDAHGVLQAAGLLFFAFAGYARIATLGEEVRDPATTIPRAIPAALAITLVIYATVAVSALAAVDVATLAHSAAPLAAAVEAGRLAAFSPVVRAGAAIASLGVLLSLTAAVARTMFAMAANADLPRGLAAVDPRSRVPHRAQIVVGVLVCLVVAVADIRSAIGFSSFAVLAYYAIANASALRLARSQRRWPRSLAVLGLAGCGVLAFSLPAESVVTGALLLLGGGGWFLARRRPAPGAG